MQFFTAVAVAILFLVPMACARMPEEDRSDEWFFRADASAPPPQAGAAAGQQQQQGAAATTGMPCSPLGKCFQDSDCGVKGRCLGIAVGKCDCTHCVPGILCNIGEAVGQAPCGGLQNACNSTSNLCNCEHGYQQAGFKNTGDAILKFCSKQSCDGSQDTCFGLPCKSGVCVCL